MGSSFGLRRIANMIDFIDAAVRISFRTVLLSYFFVLPIELGVVKLEAAEALIKGDAATNKGWRCWHWEMFIFIFIFIFIFFFPLFLFLFSFLSILLPSLYQQDTMMLSSGDITSRAAVMLVFCCCLLVSVVQAKDIYVSPSGNNNNPGTQSSPLASIVYAAAIAESGDSILLFKGTFVEAGSITVTAKSLTFAPASGQEDVNILVPSGSVSSIFVFQSAVASVSGISLNGKGGTVPCVYSLRSSVTISSTSISNCNSTNSSGGAIFLQQSSFLLQNCSISQNSGMQGGAIYSDATSSLAVHDCKFTGNFGLCPALTFAAGGAISNDGTNLTVSSSSFIGNFLLCENAWGAAISSESTQTVIQDCSFIGNNFGPFQYGGGAVFGAGMFVGCLFANNSAGFGGAISVTDSTNIIDCEFTGNIASGDGGAIDVEDIKPLTIRDCTFTRNVALNNQGGAINALRADLKIYSSMFTENSAAANGGAIYNDGYQSLIHPDGILLLASSIFNSNTAGLLGGAIYSSNFGQAELTLCSFTNNTVGLGGGAIFSQNFLSVEHSKFLNNSAAIFGGAIYNLGQIINVDVSSFTDSSATFGGAIYIAGGTHVFGSSDFSNNSAVQDGGALFIAGGTGDWFAVTFQCNTAGIQGQDVYSPSPDPNTFNCEDCRFNPC